MSLLNSIEKKNHQIPDYLGIWELWSRISYPRSSTKNSHGGCEKTARWIG